MKVIVTAAITEVDGPIGAEITGRDFADLTLALANLETAASSILHQGNSRWVVVDHAFETHGFSLTVRLNDPDDEPF